MTSLLIAAFIFGLVVGSFLNVCIHRIPLGGSVLSPRRSFCPNCRHTIRFYDNVPLVSYLLLRGRCRDCAAPISPRYPAVELLTGLAFAACFLWWGPAPAALVNSLFLSLLIALGFIDFDHQILPNVLTIPGAIAGLLLSAYQDAAFYEDPVTLSAAAWILPGAPERIMPVAGSVLGALAGSLLLFVVGRAYLALRRAEGLGMGDVKMMALVGAFLGWRLALLTVFAGSFLGSIAGIYLMLARGRDMKYRLAFGTFLSAGAAFCLFAGLRLLRWYLGLI